MTKPTASAQFSDEPAPDRPTIKGGQIALRGMQAQILIALYDVLSADPPFTTLTLETDEGNDKFDYVWENGLGPGYAVQVKTTRNQFSKPQVKRWAEEMRAGETARVCSLHLLGTAGPGVQDEMKVAGVRVQLAKLNFDMLGAAVAQHIARLTDMGALLPVGLTEIFTDAAVGRLFDLAKNGAPITRPALRTFLLDAIALAPREGRTIDISRLVEYTPRRLLGRDEELALLDQHWAGNQKTGNKTGNKADNKPGNLSPIVAIVAQGGEGKTGLLTWWLKTLQERDWPGARVVYAWSFYSQGSQEQHASSSDIFLFHALRFFGAQELADSQRSSAEKGAHLARLLVQQRALLLLDGLEPLQYPPGMPNAGDLRDQGIAAVLRGLCGAGAAGALCVLTSRMGLTQFGAHVKEVELRALPQTAAVALLREQNHIGSEQDFIDAVRDLHGHALSISILAHYVWRAHGGDIRKRALAPLTQADAARGGHAARVLDAYCRWLGNAGGEEGARLLALLQVLGLFDRPAGRACVQSLLGMGKPPKVLAALFPRKWRWVGKRQALPAATIECALSDLHAAHLLTKDPAQGEWQTLDAHPLLREYFAQRWRKQDPAGFRAAHKHLFEFLQAQTKEGDQPSLADLLPLYQAVAHGCWAGEVQAALDDVYWQRIVRGDEFYSSKKLGARAQNLAAIACFFTQPWQQVAPGLSEANQSWLLSQAALSLRALGRLAEAVPAMHAALAMVVARQSWINAAAQASNLAELHLLLGQIAESCSSAQQALTYADQSRDAAWRMVCRTTLADAQHQAGQTAAALALMQEAERMQEEEQPASPLLYSVQGFQYCELLLASGTASAQQVTGRARQTLVIAERNHWLLDIALDHLSLARCALQQGLPEARAEAEQALAGIRQSGNSEFLPRALLTRAAVLCASDSAAAIADLNESFELCERGPMPLFMADTLLTRVRLFAAAQPYPWESPQADLQEARRIIDTCGYERRRAELDALSAQFALAAPEPAS